MAAVIKISVTAVIAITSSESDRSAFTAARLGRCDRLMPVSDLHRQVAAVAIQDSRRNEEEIIMSSETGARNVVIVHGRFVNVT